MPRTLALAFIVLALSACSGASRPATDPDAERTHVRETGTHAEIVSTRSVR